MKKLYATILAAVLGSTALMAQEEHALSFIRNGEVLADGATVTISEPEFIELIPGMMYIVEMDPKLSVRNNEENNVKATIDCYGEGANYREIEFCWGQCKGWGESNMLSSTIDVAAGSDMTAFIHIGGKQLTSPEFIISDAAVNLKLYPAMDPDDLVTLTLRFDTTGAGIKGTMSEQQVEIFNLCGRKISDCATTLPTGVYIIRTNGHSRKVVIK